MSERKWYNDIPAPAMTYSGRQHIVTVQNWLREREEQEKREKAAVSVGKTRNGNE